MNLELLERSAAQPLDPELQETFRRSRLRGSDLLRLGFRGMTSRPMRAVLSALGIAIGVAAMVAILGITASSQTQLNDQLAKLGTNRLTVEPGKSLLGQPTTIGAQAPGMISRIAGVQSVGYINEIGGGLVHRSRYSDPNETLGIKVASVGGDLRGATGVKLRTGRWLDPGLDELPVVVLGVTAAKRLGVTATGQLLLIGGSVFTVIGILEPATLNPELDGLALISPSQAKAVFDLDVSPSSIYVRGEEQRLNAIRELIPPTASPESPSEILVSLPSDALAAKNLANQTLTTLLLGLGSVALLVGGIGVANTMVIAVIERRSEIGLRRALGATRAHIRRQFLTEAIILSAVGGLLGAVFGTTATGLVALNAGWRMELPLPAIAGGVGVTVLIGVIAGLYPAIRAARIPPTVALTG